MKNLINLIIIASLIALSSCTGTNLKVSGQSHKNRGDAININELVDIYSITPRLIEQLKANNIFYQKYAQPKENKILKKQIANYNYRIGIGDILKIVIWNHPELTAPVGSTTNQQQGFANLVKADGTIFYPYIGNVKVAGKTINQVRTDITRRLNTYIQSPQLEIQIEQFNSQFIHVTGEVKNSGKQAIGVIPLTILDAISAAGGTNGNADWNTTTLIRDGQKHPFSLLAMLKYGNLTENQLLKNGDIIFVPNNKNNKIYVMGEVGKQITIPISTTTVSLAEALNNAEGINMSTSSPTGVFVIRPKNNTIEKTNASTIPSTENVVDKNLSLPGNMNKANKIADVYQLDLTDAKSYVLATSFELESNDVVFVSTAPIERWNRVLSKLMPTISNMSYISKMGK